MLGGDRGPVVVWPADLVPTAGRVRTRAACADPVLTEGFQSGLVACVVLAGIAVLLALTLLGAPRKAPQEQLEQLPATGGAN